MSDTDNPVDLNAPVSESELAKRLDQLSETERQQLRDQQIHIELMKRAEAKRPPTAKDLARMSNEEFERYKRSIGAYD